MRTAYPNRFFGSNPVAMPNAGKKEGGFPSDLPRTWRSALGLEDGGEGEAKAGSAAQSTQWEGEPSE